MIYAGIVVVGYFIVGKFILWATCRQKNKALQKNYINILSVIIVPFWVVGFLLTIEIPQQ
jgi:hypothetical protein